MNNYEVKSIMDTYQMIELFEKDTNSRVRICPERGGIATELVLNGQSLFYLDEATLLDKQANIRGGNPILFPICGQLHEMSYEWQGERYSMKNHGVARVHPWEVADSNEQQQASVSLRLRSNEETLLSFPFEFELLFTYTLKNGSLKIDQRYCNHSDRVMPMYAGFHPYFATERKALSYETDATQYYDYNDEKTKPLNGPVDLEGLVESVVLLDARSPEISFSPHENCQIKLAYSEQFKYVVLWSVQGKPFVCIEPWMARTDELNRKQELPRLEAGGAMSAWLSISCSLL